METRRMCVRFFITKLLYFPIVAVLFTHCDARNLMVVSKDLSLGKNQNIKHLKILEVAKSLNMLMDVSIKDSSNSQPYVSSPFTLQPYDSLAPNSLPDNDSPPYCVYPPPNSQTPSTTIPSPIDYSPAPPSTSFPSPTGSSPIPPSTSSLSPPPDLGSTLPNPPEIGSSPPTIFPGPPENIPSPSSSVPNAPNYEPSPPSGNVPSPPEDVPSPFGFAPSPPVFQPPVVYPPPTGPPPSYSGGSRGSGVWCVAKPSVPDPIIQEAMNYACGSGADCGPLQPNGQCYQPNTLLEHASYAFNSYWQRTKVAGGTCSFGGTAMLVTVDPSSSTCRF